MALRNLAALALAVAVAVGCASSSASVREQRSPEALSVARSGVLAEMRRQLDVVRAARPSDHVEGHVVADVASLVGAPRQQVESNLGAGTICKRESEGLCESVGDAYYSLYHLPEPAGGLYSVGGGLELVVRYEGTSRVVEVGWVHTQ